MSSAPIRLGVFELFDVIGRGAVGEIWGGLHPGQDVPVAVKVLNDSHARDDAAVEAFRTEVRAVAGLTHPGIILLFDHGIVDRAAEAASGGRLVAGSPYLVMELASSGSLREVEFKSWAQVRYVLFSLLDALGHAHSRDVLHRDLKPGNVVVCGEGDARPGLKLTDFGIARTIESRTDEGEVEVTAGTPRYMAPEQFRGRFRDAGPWTDLYALGCIAYEIVAGRPPFEGANAPMLAMAHMVTAPPPIENPLFPLPEGVEAWIGRLLEKDPRARFRRAADAAFGLMPLGNSAGMPLSSFEATFRGDRLDVYEIATIQTTPLDRNRVQEFDPLATVVTYFRDDLGKGAAAGLEWAAEESTRSGSPKSEAPGVAAAEVAPIAATWRAPIVARPPLKLVGAGLGLFGFRAIPLVGRNRERDILWDGVCTVEKSGTPHVMVIEGPPGVGKSRLVEWMAARAAELGAAIVLHATHGKHAAPAHGLGRMIGRQLRCVGLTAQKAAALIRPGLEAQGVRDAYEWKALAAAAMGDGEGLVRFHNRDERYAVLHRHLMRLGSERPVIVWLDDVQWGRDALAFVRYVLDHRGQGACPVLFLLTHRGGPLPELDGQRDVERLPLDTLEDAAQGELIEELLALSHHLASHVRERTAGNPLFAIELVGDWVARGVLEIGPGGFVLAPGEAAQIPDGIHDVWRARVDALLAGHPPSFGRALELAAVLGESLSLDEWHEVCRQATVDSRALLESLAAARLMHVGTDEVRFAHRMFHESVVRVAADEGRVRAHHATCASALGRLYAPEGLHGERIADHLFRGGAWQRCLEPLLLAAEERVERAEYEKAERLLSRYAEALGHLAPADQAFFSVKEWLVRARMEARRGNFEYAEPTARKAEDLAARNVWLDLRGEALLVQARLAHQAYELDRATRFYNDALDSFGGADAPTMQVAALVRPGSAPRANQGPVAAWYGEASAGRVEVLLGLGDVARRQGDLGRATTLLDRALQAAQSRGDGRLMAQALRGLGGVRTVAGDIDGAHEAYRSALQFATDQGHRFQAAGVHNGLGEVERARGDINAAIAEYQLAIDLFRSVGSRSARFSELNLGLCLLLQQRYADARTRFEAVRRAYEAEGAQCPVGAVYAGLAACAANRRSGPAVSANLRAVRAIVEASGAAEMDDVWPLKLAGDRLAATDKVRAREAYELAWELWDRMGRHAERDDVNEAIRALIYQ